MKTPCENTEFSFLLKRKLLISFLLFPSEKKRNSRLKLVKRVIFLKCEILGKIRNFRFWKILQKLFNFFVL